MHLSSFKGLFQSLLAFPEGLSLLFCQNTLYGELSEVIQSLASPLAPVLVRQLSFNWVFELGAFSFFFFGSHLFFPSQARQCGTVNLLHHMCWREVRGNRLWMKGIAQRRGSRLGRTFPRTPKGRGARGRRTGEALTDYGGGGAGSVASRQSFSV